MTAGSRAGLDFAVAEDWVRDHLRRCQAPGDHGIEDLSQVASHPEEPIVACTALVRERPLEPAHRRVAVVDLEGGGFTLLDTQFVTDHLRQFGTIEIDRTEFQDRLQDAVERVADFSRLPVTASAEEVLEIVKAQSVE